MAAQKKLITIVVVISPYWSHSLHIIYLKVWLTQTMFSCGLARLWWRQRRRLFDVFHYSVTGLFTKIPHATTTTRLNSIKITNFISPHPNYTSIKGYVDIFFYRLRRFFLFPLCCLLVRTVDNMFSSSRVSLFYALVGSAFYKSNNFRLLPQHHYNVMTDLYRHRVFVHLFTEFFLYFC